MSVFVSAGVRRGGLPPGSPEAKAAIERVRQMVNRIGDQRPAWSIVVPVEQESEPVTRRNPRGPSTTRYERTCAVCGTIFEARQPNARYCGKSCENRAYKVRRAMREETAA